MAATNASGAKLWEERYLPFGEKLVDPSANQDRPGYTGHIQDSWSGLTYMQARYYDPVLGRFMQTDPIGYQDQLNLYAYVANDPVNNIDPDGREIVILGTDAEKQKFEAMLGKIEAADPTLAAKIQDLRESENTHYIIDTPEGGMPNNRTIGVLDNESNGEGTGSVTQVDPDQTIMTTNSDGTQVSNSPETVLTHELAGHAHDKDQGVFNRSIDPNTGNPISEDRAMEMESLYKDSVGEKRRDQY